MKIPKLEKQHAMFVWVGLVAFVLLAVIFLLISFSNRGPGQHPLTDPEWGSGEEQEASKSLLIKNIYQLRQTYGYAGAAAINQQLEEIVFAEDELAAATKEAVSVDGYSYHYDSTLIEASFRIENRDPATYAFTLEVSDGRSYDVHVRPCFDDNVEPCFGVVAVRDGVVNYNSPAVDEEAKAALEDWKNQF